MKQTILIFISLILLIGCSSKNKSTNEQQFGVQSSNLLYGKKYHFILERRLQSRSRDVGGLLGSDKYIYQYHIYTDSLGKVSGNQVLFKPVLKTYKAKKMGSNSIFIFNKNEIILKNTKMCFDYMTPKCSDSGLNGKYPIKDISILSKTPSKSDLQGGYFQ